MSSAPPPPPGPELPERPPGAEPAWTPPAAEPPRPAGDGAGAPGPGAPRFVAPRPRPAAEDAETPWRPWTGIVALLAAFMVAVVGQLLIAAIGTAFGMDLEDPMPAVNILATLFQDGAFVGAAILFARAAGAALPRHFGLRRTRLWPAVGAMALAMVTYYLLAGAWAALIGLEESDTLPDSLGVEETTVAFVAVCVLVTVIAPIAEEVLFRGYMFGALRNWRGPWVGALITGVIFGGIHAGGTDVEYLPPLMILGAALCILRWRTGSLLPCIALHALNNAIAFGVTAADWEAWQVVLLVVGAVFASLLLTVPFLDRGRSDAAPATT